MGKLLNTFIKGSNNTIDIRCLEDNEAIDVAPTQIEFIIGNVTVTRTPTGDGVTYAAGTVTINPGKLTEDVSSLVTGEQYRGYVVIFTASNTEGVIYGGDDSLHQLYFNIQDSPT